MCSDAHSITSNIHHICLVYMYYKHIGRKYTSCRYVKYDVYASLFVYELDVWDAYITRY